MAQQEPLYFCIADGMADFMPNMQDYHHCSNISEAREVIRLAVESFASEYSASEAPYFHVVPDHVWQIMEDRGASSVNWRLCIARNEDRVLDVIGMTQEEYSREMDCEA